MIDEPTTRATAKDLMKGVVKGFGKGFDKINYNSPHHEALKHLEKNVYQFSGAKNYQQLKALTEALYDGNRLRTKKEFFDASKKIVTEFNVAWRDAEYDTAVSNSQMAAKWLVFEKNKHLMPYLKFVGVGDSHECAICWPFNNMVRHIDDPVWRYAMPTLHFRDRCTVIQLPSSEVEETPDSDVPGPDGIPKIFRVNCAKEALAFPPGHPYYKGVPKSILAQAAGLIPEERRFERIHDKGKGTVSRHVSVNTDAEDYRLVEKIAKELSHHGHTVEILPEVNEHDIKLRKTLLPGVKQNKNPDLRVNNKYVEVKNVEGAASYNQVSNAIKRASHQADHVIINLEKNINRQVLERAAIGRFNTHPDLQVIEFRYKGKYTRFDKKVNGS